MTQQGSRDYAGLVAVILAVTLSLILVVALVASLVGREINEAAQRLLTTIGAGLVGALGVYVGSAVRRRNGGE